MAQKQNYNHLQKHLTLIVNHKRYPQLLPFLKTSDHLTQLFWSLAHVRSPKTLPLQTLGLLVSEQLSRQSAGSQQSPLDAAGSQLSPLDAAVRLRSHLRRRWVHFHDSDIGEGRMTGEKRDSPVYMVMTILIHLKQNNKNNNCAHARP